MKSISIRMKITLWYTAALILVALFTLFSVLFVSRQILLKTIRDSVIVAVENNIDEIEYFESYEALESTSDVDHFIEYGSGYLEIDDDFLNHVNEVYTSLYYEDITLLYGENPISKETSELELVNSQVQTINVDGTMYYVFDRALTNDGLDGLWLRGVVSEKQGTAQMTDITKLTLIFLPVVILLAAIGGYLIARRTLRPIQQISDTAKEIEQGGDLKRRIELGEGNDEIHRLADNFNDMFTRLDDAFEAERQFTSDVSHELRTPVSVIMAQCELSLNNKRSAEEYEKDMQLILRQTTKMSKLINDMLECVRIERKAENYQKEKINISALTTSVCEDMALIRENNISLEYKIQENVFCNANSKLIERLVQNLINNAYRYGKENGHILVELKSEENKIELKVTDDGIGISEDDQKNIFRRFYQSDNSRCGKGTGLGLSMAYEIAKFHGGKLSVTSELGKGSVFTFSFKNKL